MTLQTWDILPQLGFEPDDTVWSDKQPGLSIDLGNLRLKAGQMMNRRFVEVVSISGAYSTKRTITEINVELPLTIKSRGHCTALIAFFIDKKLGRDFMPLKNGDWLEKGRKNKHLLPKGFLPQEYVFWMPKNEASFIMPLQQMQVAGVIKALKGQQLDADIYYWLLADRVQELINACDDREDAVNYTFDVMERIGLIRERPPSIEEAGRHLVVDNSSLQEHLYLAGITNELPSILDENDARAEALYEYADLESWFSAATWGL